MLSCLPIQVSTVTSHLLTTYGSVIFNPSIYGIISCFYDSKTETLLFLPLLLLLSLLDFVFSSLPTLTLASSNMFPCFLWKLQVNSVYLLQTPPTKLPLYFCGFLVLWEERDIIHLLKSSLISISLAILY